MLASTLSIEAAGELVYWSHDPYSYVKWHIFGHFLDELLLPRTPCMRSSENSSSRHSGAYQALGVEESKLNSMPVLGVPARDMVG